MCVDVFHKYLSEKLSDTGVGGDDSVGKTLAIQGGKPDFSIHLEKDQHSGVFLSPQSRAER